jgi:hypothetical protein
VVVVVLRKAGDGDFGFDQADKALAVQDLALEYRRRKPRSCRWSRVC